ncbi:MAG: hypothetical protein JWP97_3980 [Labilithrix sp.]|nr:hypothetical protein [Labilithrix sp.]
MDDREPACRPGAFASEVAAERDASATEGLLLVAVVTGAGRPFGGQVAAASAGSGGLVGRGRRRSRGSFERGAFRRGDGAIRIGAAAEALLVRHEVLVVRAGRRTAAGAHRAPVAPLQDRRAPGRARRARPLVDVPGHVVDAERAPARGPGAGRLRLPQPVELARGSLAVARLERAFLEGAPVAVDHAGARVSREAVRVRPRLLALAGERPLALAAQPLRRRPAEGIGLAVGDDDERVLAEHVRVLEAVHAEVEQLRRERGDRLRDLRGIERAAAGRELLADPGAGPSSFATSPRSRPRARSQKPAPTARPSAIPAAAFASRTRRSPLVSRGGPGGFKGARGAGIDEIEPR